MGGQFFSPLVASCESPTAASYFPTVWWLAQRPHPLPGGGLGQPEALAGGDHDVRVMQ